MQCEMLVLDEGYNTFKSKGEERKEYLINLKDIGQGKRCSNNFQFQATQEQLDKYKGKLRDTRVVVTIESVAARFNGDIAIKGEIEPLAKKAA